MHRKSSFLSDISKYLPVHGKGALVSFGARESSSTLHSMDNIVEVGESCTGQSVNSCMITYWSLGETATACPQCTAAEAAAVDIKITISIIVASYIHFSSILIMLMCIVYYWYCMEKYLIKPHTNYETYWSVTWFWFILMIVRPQPEQRWHWATHEVSRTWHHSKRHGQMGPKTTFQLRITPYPIVSSIDEVGVCSWETSW